MLKKCDKIYVVCPAHNKTGGLELLHQLVYSLNKQGYNAYITYILRRNNNPTHDEYKKYVNNYKDFEDIEDKETSCVVLPEVYFELVDSLKKAQVVGWWLSIDNYLAQYSFAYSLKNDGRWKILDKIKNGTYRYTPMHLRRKLKYNFAQSYYALEYLNKNKFSNVDYLSDYINDSYLDVKEDIEKKNVVLYNPKKGLKFTEYLMSIDKSITWIPLINLTNQQVKDLTNTSKVYIDFGNHPGKDRFPREAAISGCCIITGKKGAAAFFKDVPIPEKYKFEDKKENGYSIINKIKECFDNYEECYKDFEFYREMIKNEHKLFDDDVKRLF